MSATWVRLIATTAVLGIASRGFFMSAGRSPMAAVHQLGMMTDLELDATFRRLCQQWHEGGKA